MLIERHSSEFQASLGREGFRKPTRPIHIGRAGFHPFERDASWQTSLRMSAFPPRVPFGKTHTLMRRAAAIDLALVRGDHANNLGCLLTPRSGCRPSKDLDDFLHFVVLDRCTLHRRSSPDDASLLEL